MPLLLQGILPTHGWNPGVLHCTQILQLLSYREAPTLAVWVVCLYDLRAHSKPSSSSLLIGWDVPWTDL